MTLAGAPPRTYPSPLYPQSRVTGGTSPAATVLLPPGYQHVGTYPSTPSGPGVFSLKGHLNPPRTGSPRYALYRPSLTPVTPDWLYCNETLEPRTTPHDTLPSTHGFQPIQPAMLSTPVQQLQMPRTFLPPTQSQTYPTTRYVQSAATSTPSATSTPLTARQYAPAFLPTAPVQYTRSVVFAPHSSGAFRAHNPSYLYPGPVERPHAPTPLSAEPISPSRLHAEAISPTRPHAPTPLNTEPISPAAPDASSSPPYSAQSCDDKCALCVPATSPATSSVDLDFDALLKDDPWILDVSLNLSPQSSPHVSIDGRSLMADLFPDGSPVLGNPTPAATPLSPSLPISPLVVGGYSSPSSCGLSQDLQELLLSVGGNTQQNRSLDERILGSSNKSSSIGNNSSNNDGSAYVTAMVPETDTDSSIGSYKGVIVVVPETDSSSTSEEASPTPVTVTPIATSPLLPALSGSFL